MLFLILVTLVALGVASPYIYIIFRRGSMLKKLTLTLGERGYRIKKLRRFVCLSLNTADSYDLLIYNKTHAYPVKLWSTAKRNSTLVIRRNGRVYETYSVEAPLDTDKGSGHTVSGRSIKVKRTRENFKVSPSKTVIPVLLYYPQNKRVIADLGAKRKNVRPGDKIFGKTLCSPKYLESMLSGEEAALVKSGKTSCADGE